MKTLFLINARAGRGAARQVWQRLAPLVAGRPEVEAVIPESAEATRQAASEAARSGYERVVAVGGDGTLRLVAGVLAGTDTSVGLVPAGTGNDFCREMGMPRQPEAALAVALGKATVRTDLGQANGAEPFLNAAGVGFDADVAVRAFGYPAGLGGTLPYLMGALTTIFQWRPVAAEVLVDDQRFAGEVTLVAVANGKHYGGGMRIAPMADRNDGLLDVCVAEGMGRGQMLGLLPQVYTGGHARSPKVHFLRGRQVQIRVDQSVKAHVDGEPYAWDDLRFATRPGALTMAMENGGRR